MDSNSKVYISGHRGMVGSAILRNLEQKKFSNIITRNSAELNLCNQQQVNDFFALEKPEYVFLAAAKVGGIHANKTYRAEFIYNNLMIEANIIEAAFRVGVKKLLFLGSSCIYPKLAPQPLREEYLLSGYLEPTNQSYAIAKIAGIEMCNAYRAQYGCNFISVMPTNLYGPNDNYDLENSHVLPALLRKMLTAKQYNLPNVQIWGTGTPRREFLHVDDLADACVFLMKQYNEAGLVNVGCGEDISILELAQLIAQIVGFTGEITTNPSQPDGTPRKLLDVSKLHSVGWKHSITLQKGIEQVYSLLKEIQWPMPA
ncbi:MAG: GDP-L-fucose synthase [Chitinophagia bacterium]|jgi:GDP-L-fucose synthase